MLEKLHVLLAIFAAIVVGISGFVFEMELQQFCITLISVIVVFYVIGLIARKMIKSMVSIDLKEDEEVPEDIEAQDSEAISMTEIEPGVAEVEHDWDDENLNI